MLSTKDINILLQQTDQTLAKWHCKLNSFETPEELNVYFPEDAEALLHSRAMEIMGWIESRVDKKLISRTWNKKMTDEEFNDFWEATHERR